MATRNSARKRKEKPKSDDEAPAKRGKPNNEKPTKRAPAPRLAKAKRGDLDWLVTNEDSYLANEDLHKQLFDPKTYEGFTFQDWDDLREELPETAPLNPDGHTIPMEYFRYDPDFRRAIREFQEDLATGRLDPGWQAAAGEAMEERARGAFDDWKERNFEEFWGQKQKLDHGALAGEATNLKLDTMIEHGLFKVNDEIFFSRAIGRRDGRILIEKECRVVNVGRDTMTVAIPSGQLKYSRSITAPELLAAITPTKGQKRSSRDNTAGEGTTATTPPLTAPQVAKHLDEGQGKDSLVRVAGLESSAVPTPHAENAIQHANSSPIKSFVKGEDPAIAIRSSITLADNPGSSMEDVSLTAARDIANDTAVDLTSDDMDTRVSLSQPMSEPQDHTDEVVFHEFKNLKHLHDKIVEIDGRKDPKNIKEVPAVNTWKIMRAKRNNQDLGTIFDMREHFFLYKLPKIEADKTPAATPRKKR